MNKASYFYSCIFWCLGSPIASIAVITPWVFSSRARAVFLPHGLPAQIKNKYSLVIPRVLAHLIMLGLLSSLYFFGVMLAILLPLNLNVNLFFTGTKLVFFFFLATGFP